MWACLGLATAAHAEPSSPLAAEGSVVHARASLPSTASGSLMATVDAADMAAHKKELVRAIE
jgi:hypothetical protein